MLSGLSFALILRGLPQLDQNCFWDSSAASKGGAEELFWLGVEGELGSEDQWVGGGTEFEIRLAWEKRSERYAERLSRGMSLVKDLGPRR